MQKRHRFFAFAMSALLLGLILAAPSPTRAEGMLSLSAARSYIDGGSAFTVALQVDDTPGLYAAQFSLEYDNTLLDVLAVQPGPGWPEQLAVAQAFATEGGTQHERVQFAASAVGEQGFTAPGALVIVTFSARRVDAPVETTLTLSDQPGLLLLNNQAQLLDTTAPDPLTLTVGPQPTLAGSIELQGPDSRPIKLTVEGESFTLNTHLSSGQAFDLDVPSASAPYRLTASAPCHLTAVLEDVPAPAVDLSTRLLAGDVNADQRINILDLALVANRFGQDYEGSCSNVDGDAQGHVDLLDLVMVARNYGEGGPQSW